jgi:hypothetical protein
MTGYRRKLSSTRVKAIGLLRHKVKVRGHGY